MTRSPVYLLCCKLWVVEFKFRALVNIYRPHVDDALAVIPTGMTYLPLHTFSEKAGELVDREAKKLLQQGKKWPPGQLESYKVQVEMLNSKRVPACEILTAPWAPRETGAFLTDCIVTNLLAHIARRPLQSVYLRSRRAMPSLFSRNHSTSAFTFSI